MSRWLVELIEKRLHEVLIPIDPNNPVCRVDLRAGLIELEDVRLHAAFLSRNYTLPVEVLSSHVRRVRVKFSLRALLTRHRIELELDGLALVLAPRDDPPIEVARSIFRREKQQAIAGAELWQAHSRSISNDLGAQPDGSSHGGMRKLRAFGARVAMQALLNATVRLSHVHIRYEFTFLASGAPAAFGVMVRSATVADPPKEQREAARSEGGGGTISRALCVEDLSIYCVSAASAGIYSASGSERSTSPAAGQDAGGSLSAMACLAHFGGGGTRGGAQAAAAAEEEGGAEGEAEAASDPSWLLCPLSFDLRLVSQTSEAVDLSRPRTAITLHSTLQSARRRGAKGAAAADRVKDGTPVRVRLQVSAWQVAALEEVDKSLVLYVRRQRARLNGRPDVPVRAAPREWWRYALRCIFASREALEVCTELSGHSWNALWRVLAIRQRYLHLHRRGRYNLPQLPPLSLPQREELLTMEELLELDTILLFRRFVHWQMVQLHGEPAAHEAYLGGGLDQELLRVDESALSEPGKDSLYQFSLADLQSLTQVATKVLSTTDSLGRAASSRFRRLLPGKPARSPGKGPPPEPTIAKPKSPGNGRSRRPAHVSAASRRGSDGSEGCEGGEASLSATLSPSASLPGSPARGAGEWGEGGGQCGGAAGPAAPGVAQVARGGEPGGGASGGAPTSSVSFCFDVRHGDTSPPQLPPQLHVPSGEELSPPTPLSEALSTPLTTPLSTSSNAAATPFGKREDRFLLRHRGERSPSSALQPSRERRVRRKRSHLFAKLSEVLHQSEHTRGPDGSPLLHLPAWLVSPDSLSSRRRSTFALGTARESLSPLDGSASARRSLLARAASSFIELPANLAANLVERSSSQPPHTPHKRAGRGAGAAQREGSPAADWQLLAVQGLLYETWRDKQPEEVEALEQLTASAVRDANSTLPPDHPNLAFDFDAPIYGELRVFATGRQRLFLATEQYVLSFRRAHDRTKSLRLLAGPVSVAALQMRVCNQAALALAAESAIGRLREAAAGEAAARPPLPHQTAASQLLDDRHAAFMLCYTKAPDTRLRKSPPQIALRIAPDVAMEAHLPLGFVLAVPRVQIAPPAPIMPRLDVSAAALRPVMSRDEAGVPFTPRAKQRRLTNLSFPAPHRSRHHKRSATVGASAAAGPLEQLRRERSGRLSMTDAAPSRESLPDAWYLEAAGGAREEAESSAEPAAELEQEGGATPSDRPGRPLASAEPADGAAPAAAAASGMAPLPPAPVAERVVLKWGGAIAAALGRGHHHRHGGGAPPARSWFGLLDERRLADVALRDDRHVRGAVDGPLALGQVGQLVVPETAIVASAVLPGSLGLFCHAPPAAPGAPPFVYVPVLGTTRLPNMLGYAQVEYDAGVVQAFGAGEKAGVAGAPRAPPVLTGILRSTDVVAKNAYARRLLRDFERRRFEAGAARLLPLPAGSGGAEAEAAPAAAEATAGWWAAGSSWVSTLAETWRDAAAKCVPPPPPKPPDLQPLLPPGALGSESFGCAADSGEAAVADSPDGAGAGGPMPPSRGPEMVVGRSTSGGIVVVGAEGRHRGPSPSSSPPTSRIGRADAAVPATAGEPRSAAAAAAAPRLGDTPPTPPTLAGIAETPTPEVAAGEGGGRAGPDGGPGQATVHGRKQAPSSKASKQPAPPLDPQLLELSGQLGGLSAGADVAGMVALEGLSSLPTLLRLAGLPPEPETPEQPAPAAKGRLRARWNFFRGPKKARGAEETEPRRTNSLP